MHAGKLSIGLLLMAAVFVACSDGSALRNTSSNGAPAVSLSGTISAFGSVVVHGVHYDTDGAAIMLNGRSATQADLAVGQMARIHGTAPAAADAHGHADRVDVDDDVIGPVSAVDSAAGTLTVLAQQVTVGSDTSYSHDVATGDLSGIKAGDIVGVSGMAGADGSIHATRIELEQPGTPYQIVGRVSALDDMMHTFAVNALVVGYGGAMVSGFTGGVLANGDFVVARGSMFDAGTSTLTATQVTPYDDESTDEASGSHVEREGLVTRFVSPQDFDVAGKPVTTTDATTYSGGTSADLALNLHVEVDGTLDASGTLVASRIQIYKSGVAELKGPVTAIDVSAGTVTLLGTTVSVTMATRFEDEGAGEMQDFSLASLSVGDTVKIRGYEDPVGSGMVTATRLEREAPQATDVVGGYYIASTAPLFDILGVSIDASSASFYSNERTGGEEGSGNTQLTSEQFFAQAPGHVVFVEGNYDGILFTATKVMLSSRQDCDGSGGD